jgi:Homing endonuclease associated repeat
MTKQEIQEQIVACAEKLGHVPSITEFMKMTPISRRQVRRHFGSYTRALAECNMESRGTGGGGNKVPLEKLFLDWATITQTLNKPPSMGEYEMLSKYSTRPLVRHFGSWRQVAYGLKQFAESHGLAEQWQPELGLVGGTSRDEAGGTAIVPATTCSHWPPALLSRPAYGPPMWPGPMTYAPVNEMGVVFLFGAIAWHLGFVAQRWQTQFPDCELIRRIGEDRCQLVRAELEYESRNFLKHMHDINKCDLVICWKHNWPECPLEVLELRKLISAEMFARAFPPQMYAGWQQKNLNADER